MKIHAIYIFVIYLLLFLSCSDSEVPFDKDYYKNTIELSFPLEGDDVNYCCFAFEWKDSKKDQMYWLQISEDRNFDDLLFDTLVSETSVVFPNFLFPARIYYWRVSTEIAIGPLPIGEFNIIDYVDLLSGSYEAIIRSNSWDIFEDTTNTTHSTQLTIFKGDENYSLSYDTPHTNERLNLPFVEEKKEGYVLFEFDHSFSQSTDYLKYYFDSDSIDIYSSFGGNTGGGNNAIKAIYE